jgi:hypothetical protein
MAKFTVKLIQFAEEICEIEVAANSKQEAQNLVEDSIRRNMIDEEFDLYWSDGSGIHDEGVTIDDVKEKA